MPHDVRSSREAAGTSSPAVKSSIQKGTWLYRRQADPKALHACQDTPRAVEDLTKETVLSTVGERPPELMGGSSRTVLTSKQTSQILEQIGTGAEARTTSGNNAICETCEGKQIENVANLTTEGSIQEARHKNKTQLKSEDKILNRTPKQKHIRQSR